MARTFSDILKNRESSFKKLQDRVTKLNSKGFDKEDARFWKPTWDKEGNCYAEIRLLPAPPGEDEEFVLYWDHAFKGPHGWYIEKSRTSLGSDERDPVAEYNKKLWDRNGPGDRDFVSGDSKNKRPGSKRRLHYVCNVLVVDDPANPANNGGVFLYDFGKKLFEKFNEAMNPKFKDEEKFDPFDPLDGANFKIKGATEDKYPNYNRSEFSKNHTPLADTQEKMEAIWRKCHSLYEFKDPAKFKSYEDLKKRLDKILGEEFDREEAGVPLLKTAEARHEPEQRSRAEPAQKEAAKATTNEMSPPWEDGPDTGDVDPDLAEFQRLVG